MPDATPNEAVRDFTDLFVRLAPLIPSTIDEATRSVDAVIATEKPALSMNMRTREATLEVLRMDGWQPTDQIPLLDTHRRDSVNSQLGSIRNLRIEGDKLVGRLFVSESEPRVWMKIREGHIKDISVGRQEMQATRIPPNQEANVAGRSYRAPSHQSLDIMTRWLSREGSVTAIGSDEGSKIRNLPENTNMPPEITPATSAAPAQQPASPASAPVADVQAGRSDSAATDATRTGSPAATATPAAPAANPQIGADAIRQQAISEERDRVRQLTALAGQDVPAEVLTRAVNDGWNVDQASREFLTAVRGARGGAQQNGQASGAPGAQAGPAIHSRSHDVDCNVRSLAAGMLVSQGLDPTKCRMHDGRRAGREALTTQDADRGDMFARLSAVDIARECVRLDSGRHVLDYEDAIRTAVSGASLSYVFSTNVYARLTAGWARYPDTTSGWCDEEDVANFLQQEDISVTGDAKLQRLGRGDTAKDATMGDTRETYKIARFAKKFTADEQDFLDDRLGAIMRQPEEMGEAARQLRPDMVYSLMLQNPSLVADSGAVFNATAVTTAGGHANLGTASLSSTGLKAAITAMVKQRLNRTASKPGDALTIRPQYLIVPAALEWIARELTSAAALSKLFADSSDPFFATLNLLASEGLKLVIDDRVGLIGVWDPTSESARTGTDANWFLTAGGSKGLRVAYRRGTNRQPQMRSYTLDRGQWGMGWDINMDIGLAFMDYRTWYKSTGAGS